MIKTTKESNKKNRKMQLSVYVLVTAAILSIGFILPNQSSAQDDTTNSTLNNASNTAAELGENASNTAAELGENVSDSGLVNKTGEAAKDVIGGIAKTVENISEQIQGK